MKKRPLVAVLNTVAGTAGNLVNDGSTSGDWKIVKTAAGGELLLGAFRTKSLIRKQTFATQAEITQMVGIGLDPTGEAVASNKKYTIEIGSPEDRYETQRRSPYSYTVATGTVTGTAATDRLNLFTALAKKINADPKNNVRAATCAVIAFTTGSTATILAGETVTQDTSNATARVAKIVYSGGAVSSNNATGYVYLCDVVGTWSASSLVTTASGGGKFTTAAALPFGHGLVIIDDAGYFVSSIYRNGRSFVATKGDFVSKPELTRLGVYSIGVGADMFKLMPVFDDSKQNLIRGRLEYDLQDGDLFDPAKTYMTIVMTFVDGDERALDANKEAAYREVILYLDNSNTTNRDALNTALAVGTL